MREIVHLQGKKVVIVAILVAILVNLVVVEASKRQTHHHSIIITHQQSQSDSVEIKLALVSTRASPKSMALMPMVFLWVARKISLNAPMSFSAKDRVDALFLVPF